MFPSETQIRDSGVARCLYVDGLTIRAAAAALGRPKSKVQAAKQRIDEGLRRHGNLTAEARRDLVLQLLERVSELTSAA